MTHEPECQLITWGVPVPTCTCTALRAAYQRGREDAAKAVFHVIDEEHPRGIDWPQTRMYATLIAAARGDGEQA